MYWAFKLTEESKKYLLESLKEQGIEIPEGWTVYCDHNTICHEKSVSTKVWRAMSVALCNFAAYDKVLKAYAFSMNDKTLAVMVDSFSSNKYSHITVAVAPGHKPVESNEAEMWYSLKENIKLDSYLTTFNE